MKIDVALYRVILILRILVPTVPGSTTSKGLVKDEGRGEYHAINRRSYYLVQWTGRDKEY